EAGLEYLYAPFRTEKDYLLVKCNQSRYRNYLDASSAFRHEEIQRDLYQELDINRIESPLERNRLYVGKYIRYFRKADFYIYCRIEKFSDFFRTPEKHGGILNTVLLLAGVVNFL